MNQWKLPLLSNQGHYNLEVHEEFQSLPDSYVGRSGSSKINLSSNNAMNNLKEDGDGKCLL